MTNISEKADTQQLLNIIQQQQEAINLLTQEVQNLRQIVAQAQGHLTYGGRQPPSFGPSNAQTTGSGASAANTTGSPQTQVSSATITSDDVKSIALRNPKLELILLLNDDHVQKTVELAKSLGDVNAPSDKNGVAALVSGWASKNGYTLSEKNAFWEISIGENYPKLLIPVYRGDSKSRYLTWLQIAENSWVTWLKQVQRTDIHLSETNITKSLNDANLGPEIRKIVEEELQRSGSALENITGSQHRLTPWQRAQLQIEGRRNNYNLRTERDLQNHRLNLERDFLRHGLKLQSKGFDHDLRLESDQQKFAFGLIDRLNAASDRFYNRANSAALTYLTRSLGQRTDYRVIGYDSGRGYRERIVRYRRPVNFREAVESFGVTALAGAVIFPGIDQVQRGTKFRSTMRELAELKRFGFFNLA